MNLTPHPQETEYDRLMSVSRFPSTWLMEVPRKVLYDTKALEQWCRDHHLIRPVLLDVALARLARRRTQPAREAA